jgi:thioredoxin-like negative regulator of GroEL
VKITRIMGGADDLMLELQLLKADPEAARQFGVLDRFRAAWRRKPDERYTRAALARAEIILGDQAAGEALLQGLLAEDAGNLEALRLMALSRIRSAEGAVSAKGYLDRALAEDAGDYQTIFLYARALDDGDVPSPERLALLQRAVTLAPAVEDIRLTAGEAFIQAGDMATAIAVLRPLTTDPYRGESSRKARKMLREALLATTAP